MQQDAKEQLGALVVGTGFGCLTHTRALRAAGFAVRALVGRDPARTAERARRCDIPHACTSLAEALALPGVDVVTVATPPHAHARERQTPPKARSSAVRPVIHSPREIR